jgi:branched-chain amino acid transport system permease protein
VLFFLVIPLGLHEYYLSICNLVWIAVIGALGLNILVGYTGQVSIGHGAFMSVGRLHRGEPRHPARLAVAGQPARRRAHGGGRGRGRGHPLAAHQGPLSRHRDPGGQLIIEWTINHVTFISGGVQASIDVPRPRLGSMVLNTQRDMYYFLLVFVVIAIVGSMNLIRSRVGRAFIAIRDQDIAAEIIGIDIFRYKLLAFAISSFYAGVTGVLYTYFLGIANYEQFQIGVSIDYLAMIIIGGLGSILGSIFGAIFVTLLPIVIRISMENFGDLIFSRQIVLNLIPNLRLMLFGVLIIVFLIVEPDGLNRCGGISEATSASGHSRTERREERSTTHATVPHWCVGCPRRGDGGWRRRLAGGGPERDRHRRAVRSDGGDPDRGYRPLSRDARLLRSREQQGRGRGAQDQGARDRPRVQGAAGRRVLRASTRKRAPCPWPSTARPRSTRSPRS